MKTINIVGILILGLVLSSDEENNTDSSRVCIPNITPLVEIEKEVAVKPKEPIADNFSRPKRPCPPSGPGRR